MIQFFQTRSRTMVDSKDVISVKIEKINDTQIRCTLTSEDLADRQLKLSELAYGSEKAKDLFRDMMLQAQDQFGFEADNVPLMIEAIPITPDSIVLIITKVEDPEELDTRFSRFTPTPADEAADKHKSVLEHLKKLDGAEDFLDILRQMKEAVSQLPENPEALADTPVQEQAPASEAKEAAPAEPSVPPVRLFSFSRLDSVIHASHFLAEMYDGPNTLYKDEAENMYILTLAQGEHPSSDFNRICNMLSEYGSPEQGGGISLAFLEEHCDMILAKNAIQTLTSFK